MQRCRSLAVGSLTVRPLLAVIKALMLAKHYPGSNGLIARSTYPKLNDTIRKEFLKWCPDSWIKRKALSIDNVVELENGTVVNFRYIAQQGKSGEGSSLKPSVSHV